MAWVTLNDCLSTVAINKGGTGMTTNPSLAVNLASTSATSVFQANPRPGVVNTLPVSNGGTGCTNITDVRNSFLTFQKIYDATPKKFTSNTQITINEGYNLYKLNLLMIYANELVTFLGKQQDNKFRGATAGSGVGLASAYQKLYISSFTFEILSERVFKVIYAKVGQYSASALGDTVKAAGGDAITVGTIYAI